MLLVSKRSVLTAAIAAALMELRWVCRPTQESAALLTVRPASMADAELPGQRIVMVLDDQDRLPQLIPQTFRDPIRLVVIVGALPAVQSLAAALRWGAAAVALNPDQPFTELIRALHGVLAYPPPREDPNRSKLELRLRQRDRERRQFETMTIREKEVLGELITGKSAREMAVCLHVSITTVRTHIRGVLTKLGVSSQIAAVAVAHRSCRDPAVLERIRSIHQY